MREAARFAPRLAVLAGAVLWGTTGTTQALGPAAATPATVGAVRICLGAGVLLGLAGAAAGRAPWRGFFRSGRTPATVVAMVTIAAYQVLFFAGVARTGVAVGTIVGIGSAPVFTGLGELAVRRVRPGRVWMVSTALAVLGAALLVAAGGEAQVDPLGIGFALGAGASYAGYTIASKTLLADGCPPTATMAVVFAGGAVLLAPLLLVGNPGWVLTPRGAVAALWLGAATVGLAYVLFARGLAALPAATVATLTLAEPLTAAALGVTVLNERPGAVAAAGAALVTAGLVLLVTAPLLASRRAQHEETR